MKILNPYFLKAGKNRARACCKILVACMKRVTQFAVAVPSCASGREARLCVVSFRNGTEQLEPGQGQLPPRAAGPSLRAQPFHLLS